jgi:two-component system, NarL family, response regulator NreC
LEVTVRIKWQFPDTQVIILTIHVSERYVLRALDAGASAYLVKDSVSQELEPALAAIGRGEIYLSSSVSTPDIADYLRRLSTKSQPDKAPI